MLTRISIKLFRAMMDLDLELSPTQLLIGSNGAGKTSVFDVLAGIRELVVEGEKCEDVFPINSLPRWLRNPDEPSTLTQEFAIEAPHDDGILRYSLRIAHDERIARSKIAREELTLDGRMLFQFWEGKVQLHRDDHSKGPTYSFDWNRSAMGTILPDPSNRRLTWFKEQIRGIHCLRIDAPRMGARSERESPSPSRDLSNFASWHRRAVSADAASASDYLQELKQVVSGLESLDQHELGQGFTLLRAAFRKSKEFRSSGRGKAARTFWLDFDELSEGQRSLCGLYAILHFLADENTTVCIDEPDNFVALPEIQPWLFGLQDRVDSHGAQVLLSSHHPELLGLLAKDCGTILERNDSGPVTARPWMTDGSDLPPAEQIARGQERE
jgi:predicted ATPase